MAGAGEDQITSREIVELVREKFEATRPSRQPGDRTVRELAEELNVSVKITLQYLLEEVEKGTILKIVTVENGHRIILYRKAVQDVSG